MASFRASRENASPIRHVALHNPQCCHATFALHIRLPRSYVAIIEQRKARSRNRPTYEVTEMNVIRNYRSWRRYRETVNELSRLSNHELDDLGIARGEIPYVARRSV